MGAFHGTHVMPFGGTAPARSLNRASCVAPRIRLNAADPPGSCRNRPHFPSNAHAGRPATACPGPRAEAAGAVGGVPRGAALPAVESVRDAVPAPAVGPPDAGEAEPWGLQPGAAPPGAGESHHAPVQQSRAGVPAGASWAESAAAPRQGADSPTAVARDPRGAEDVPARAHEALPDFPVSAGPKGGSAPRRAPAPQPCGGAPPAVSPPAKGSRADSAAAGDQWTKSPEQARAGSPLNRGVRSRLRDSGRCRGRRHCFGRHRGGGRRR